MHNFRYPFAKRIVSLTVTAALLAACFAVPVHAEEAGTADTQQYQEDVSGESVTGTDETPGDETDNNETAEQDEDKVVEPAEDKTAEAAEDGDEDVELSPEGMLEIAGFTELDTDHDLTGEQFASKQNLSAHFDEIAKCDEGVDYVENEIVVKAKDRETALLYAKAYNAVLENYQYGYALLRLRPKQALLKSAGTDMVTFAVSASADPAINLPAAWPNYYDKLLESEYEYADFTNFKVEYDDPMLVTDAENNQWYHETISSNAAWRAGYRGQGVKVVIVDSGKATHEDIEWAGWERITGTGEVLPDASATSGHGTSVSGIIGARAGNAVGGAGIAPDCEMYMIRVTQGTGDRDITAYSEKVAIERACDVYGANVINLSLGGYIYSEYVEDAVKNAYKKGVAVVCAAGNDSLGSVVYPASYPGAIAVAATDISGNRASLSNYGSAVRYGAPGKDIGIELPGSTYGIDKGTSYSATIISGVIAVVLGSGKVTGDGSKKVDNLLRLLDSSCTCTNRGVGRGIPNLANALGLDTNTATPGIVNASKKTGVYTDAELVVELYTENSGSAHEDIIFYTDNGAGVSFVNGKLSANAKRYDPGAKITVTGKRTTTIRAIAVNPSNGLVSGQRSYTYTLRPLVSDIDVTTDTGLFKVRQGNNLALKAACIPAYAGNTAVKYEITGFPLAAGGTLKKAYMSGSTFCAPAGTTCGSYTVTCTSRDAGGYSESFDIEVTGSDKKVYSIIAGPASAIVYNDSPKDFDITLTTMEGRNKQEEDNVQDYATCTSSNSSVATAVLSGKKLTVTAHRTGYATIKVMASDGTKVSRSISITARTRPETVTINPVVGNRIAKGRSVRLTANILPADAFNKTLTWSVTAPEGVPAKNSATIGATNGYFYATNATPGVYKVKAVAKDNGEAVADYDIEVYSELTKSIKLASTSVNVYRVKNAYDSPNTAAVKVTLDGGCFETLSVTSSNPGVAGATLRKTGDDIFVDVKATGNCTGSTRITVKANDGTGRTASVPVTVSNPPSFLVISAPTGGCKNIAKGRSVRLTATFGTSLGKLSAATQRLIWESDEPDVVSVNQSGVVTGKSNSGSNTTIRVRTTDGTMSARIYITSVPVTSTITTDGLRSSGGDPITYIIKGQTAYISFKSTSNVTDHSEGNRSYINGEYSDVTINKTGLSAEWSSVSRDESILKLYANKSGTYTLTVRMKDQSPATRSVRIVVKDE